MGSKVLSIIIPSYNMEGYIENCLSSLLIPSIDLLDILVINDGSSDNTSSIARKFAKSCPKSIKVIDKENGNYGSCINAGLKYAVGKYIKILDADDSFDTINFEKFIKKISSIDCDLIITDYVMVDQKNKVISNWSLCNIQPNRTHNFDSVESKLCVGAFQMHAVTYKLKLLKDLNYEQLEGIPYTDQQWMFLPMTNVKTAYYYDAIIYRYLVGRDGQTISSDAYAKNYSAILEISNKLLDDFIYNKITSIYFIFRLQRQLELMYYIILCKTNTLIPKIDLQRFDEKLLIKFNTMYGKLNESNLLDVHFKFIEYWRQNHRSPNLLLFKLFNILIKVKSKIFN